MTRAPPALPPPPPWLAPLQDAFARVLQAPLDPSTGTLRSTVEAPGLVAQLSDARTARVRLALYHEQYRMRLFTAMQGELPRFAQVVGYWRFNAFATLHLGTTPPTQADLARCADGFAARLLGTLDGLVVRSGLPAPTPDTRPVGFLVGPSPEAAWDAALAGVTAPIDLARQALRMDEAARHAFASPYQRIWRPSPSELADLEGRRLRFATSFRLLREDWALVDRATPPSGTPGPFDRHNHARYWVSFRAPRTTALRRIEAPFARFLGEAARRPFGEAIAAIERACDATQTERLRAAMPGWIQLALSSGWWVGADPR